MDNNKEMSVKRSQNSPRRITLEQIEEKTVSNDTRIAIKESELKLEQKIHNRPGHLNTLDYYQFLLFTMKFEIKIFEFMNLIKISSIAEIFLWIVCLITSYIIALPLGSSYIFIQIIHIVRAIVGIILLCQIPKSYELLNLIKEESFINPSMANKDYTVILKELASPDILPKINKTKPTLIGYFFITFICTAVDVIGFLYLLFSNSTSKHESMISAVIITFIFLSKKIILT
jgi:hypothetical protein